MAGEKTWRNFEEENLGREKNEERRRAVMRQEAAERRRRNVHLIKYVATTIITVILTTIILTKSTILIITVKNIAIPIILQACACHKGAIRLKFAKASTLREAVTIIDVVEVKTTLMFIAFQAWHQVKKHPNIITTNDIIGFIMNVQRCHHIKTTVFTRFDMLAQSRVMENFERSLNIGCIDLVLRPVGHVCHLDLCDASHWSFLQLDIHKVHK